ncbi:MAG: exosortase-associated EpsI family protein [Candidatus Omnitrophica bacterium]|nr:exosortase-associated EpsI family protein [Candidatus Omnitrophota bacterium]
MKKRIFIILVLAGVLVIEFFVPKQKYVSQDLLKDINIPMNIDNVWLGKDISSTIKLQDETYNFVSNTIANYYTNRYNGNKVMFLVLDAGNFHNPKVCFGASGYQPTDLPKEIFNIDGRKVDANVLLFKKEKENLLLIYWLCIDKRLSSWSQQKVKDFFYSIIGKKKTGLMVRLEIPIAIGNEKYAITIAEQFISELSLTLSDTEKDYLFGKRKG